MKPASIYSLTLAALVGYASTAQAVDLLSGFGGPRNFGELAMLQNDDGSSSLLDLPFTINLYGQTFNQFYINNNGNISFLSPLWSYTPEPFPISGQPMIAPYWADVDTTGGSRDGSNNVWVAAPNHNTVVVTWDNVGYYGARTDKLNSFQLVLRNRADTGAGNFDADFRYHKLEWTTGDASGGVDGLGGDPAQAGFDAGDGLNFQILPGSLTNNVLNLQYTSNVGTPGLWTISFRGGLLPGNTPDNPLLPVITDAGFEFNFNIVLGQMMFIDPLVAIGYDYRVLSGPSFASVLLPNIGDGLFELHLWDGDQWVLSDTINAGDEYVFSVPVDRFRILGIEQSAGLDPNDPLAFVTGVTFSGSGAVSMTQIAIAVPEPGTYAMMLAGLGLLGFVVRQHRKG